MAKRPPRTPEDTSGAIAATAGGRRDAAPPATRRDASGRFQADAAKLWGERLTAANKDYTVWSQEYECNRLDEYYRGKHWRFLTDEERKKKYTTNLVFATVETQLPTLLFTEPKVKVEARPDHAQTPGSTAGERASLIEQTLQTYVDDPRLEFTSETTRCLRDAYKRFGICEVGYSADYLDNPNVGKPVLMEDGKTPVTDKTGTVVTEDAKKVKPGTERLFVKRLRPGHFRAFPGKPILEQNDWVAYGDWAYVEDVKKNPAYANTTGESDLKPSGRIASLVDETDRDAREVDLDAQRSGSMVFLWRVWDLRQQVRHVYAEGHKALLQENKPFTTLPLADIRFFELDDSFYPLPPIFNWLSPQDQINETREMQRVHRRRATRRYMHEPSVKKEERDKLASGDDMTMIEVAKVDPPPIRPIEDAPLDAQNWTDLEASKEDFGMITGVSGEARGTPQADTATQANIINIKQGLRESHARQQVAAFLGKICRLMLLALRANQDGPIFVKRHLDPFAPPAPAAQEAATELSAWKQITVEDIDTLDVDVKIDVASLSPVAQQAEQQTWDVVLGMLANPAIVPFLAVPNPDVPNEPSPLLRKTLKLHGITSENEVREIARVLKAVMVAQAQAAAASQKPDLPHATYSFKGEDLSDPLVRAAFIRSEQLTLQMVNEAKQSIVQPPGDAPTPPAPTPGDAPGPPTGIPATA